MKAGGEGDVRWLDGITDSMEMSLSKLWEMMKARKACCAAWYHKVSDMTEWLNKKRKQNLAWEKKSTS